MAERAARGGDLRLVIASGQPGLAAIRVGDSICVQGCCLTATEVRDGSFAADVSRETLALTTLGELAVGAAVNLEPALRAGEALGGHLVSGHVDGVAQVMAVSGEARSRRLSIAVPAALARYLAPKGSVAVDGVSLTVNAVENATFGVNIIPHTQAVTTLGALGVGARVNLEVDQVARYLARLLAVPE
ncbi:MAG: riboflavin synthase [Steroidobacteraceae bacterium]